MSLVANALQVELEGFLCCLTRAPLGMASDLKYTSPIGLIIAFCRDFG